MPLTPLNNDFLQCPICFNAFSLSFDRKPITLSCCHTCCSSCLKSLQSCPFDQTSINHDLPENEAILSLLNISNSNLLSTYLTNISNLNDEKLINNFDLNEDELKNYRQSIDCIQNLAQLVRPQNSSNNLLSRPMQRKLISLLNCQLVEGDGRLKAVKFCRSIGERITSELLLKHQDPYTLSANLWAAVRSRGCQFLGPALQEEILKLVLSALQDGCHLSRKVLVMYVVQRLSPHFPHQASKTAIGHVIQLLYRASCFRLTKRDGDSSLMQLKEDYCSYEALRREHDTQIVSIALESGLKISPDQWSSFLYGSPTYKSHMQSIIDKLQSPQSFNQSIQELIIALQRTQDPANLIFLKDHLERLAKIESTIGNENSTNTNCTVSEEFKNDEKLSEEDSKESKDAKEIKDLSASPQREHQQYPTYEELAQILDSCKVITFRLVDFLKQYNTLFSNVFRFSRTANFNNTGKFKSNNKTFSNVNGKSKSPTNEDAVKVNKLDTNMFNQNSINANCKTVPSALSNSVLTTGISSTFVNTTTGKLDYTTNSINSMNTLNCLNKLNKLKPCAYVPPTVLQQQQNENSNGALNGTINSTIKTNSSNSFNQANFYLNNSKISNKTSFNSPTYSPTVTKLNSATSTLMNKVNGGMTNGNLTNGLSTSSSLTNNSKNNKTDYLGKSLFYSTSISNENQKNNQNIQSIQSIQNNQKIQNDQQQAKTTPPQLASPIEPKSLDMQVNQFDQLLQSKQQNGNQKSNPNSFSFDDADDQFIPFADLPKISKFGPISRTMNLINTQPVIGSSKISLKSDNLNSSSICKNTNTIIGAVPSLIKPFNSSLFISNESTCVKK